MQTAGPPEPLRRVGMLVSANSLLMLAAFGIAGCTDEVAVAAGVDGPKARAPLDGLLHLIPAVDYRAAQR
jgi:hypothetical protein